ncbi:tetratricopeptide repeat protein [Hymenobacter sp. HMF4947]|uniref:histidine kinase n=1 Tax=Hymenobacter ginkgonis TaxID=2682976 RepID=A0A7K1TDG1_9BACT|nr:ATP-binding protein [Hymenobacter ginkgonis]MVN76201.1 tetratricopeptide repeat protein [Hymenobacter ginkgonis]
MNYRLALAIVFGLLRFGPLAAQSRPADSLRALLAQSKQPDTTRVRRLQALSDQLLARDHAQANTLAKQALALSRRLRYPAGEGNALIGLATIARLEDNYSLARRYTQQALALYTQHRKAGGLAKAYLQLSLIDEVPGANLVTALREALQGLKYAEQAHRPTTKLYLQYTLGDIYVQLGDYTTALETLQVTLRNARQQGNEPVVAATFNLLGNIHKTLRHWPEALACFRRSTRLYRKLGDLQSATTDEINLAELYALQGANELALRYSRAARREALAHADTHNLPGAELALARAQLNLGRLDSALVLAQHGFALSQQARDNMGLANASDILARTYARRGDFAPAYHYQSLWVSYQDSLAGVETQRKTSALRYGYELNKKQDQIALLTQARQLQRQQLWGLLAGLLGTVLIMGLLGRNIYLKQRANRALGEKNAYIAQQRDDLDRTLVELQATQSQLVQSEKMVALAALTAGVAHEIQNPLNFVNNFSEMGLELAIELEAETQKPTRDRALENGLLDDIKQNLLIINQHGTRAGDIVRGMLEHARTDRGQRQPLDLNKAAEEYLRLAYHNQQSKNQDFTLVRTLHLDPQLGLLQLVPQEIGRVLLNLFANAVYAVRQKAVRLGPAYVPEVRVSTARQGERVVLRVHDNGTGIPASIVKKIFDPFFTTKPPGEGTGLGLWFSYDIITKSYGGTMTVATQEGEYTEFTLTLPAAPTPPQNVEASAAADGRLAGVS